MTDWEDSTLDNHEFARLLEKLHWHPAPDHEKFKCGYCGVVVASELGLRQSGGSLLGASHSRDIRVCPACSVATTFVNGKQLPRPLTGERFDARGKSPEISLVVSLYDEARSAFSTGAASCTVLMLRKLLMHIAVEQGAKEGLRFEQYCEQLKSAGVVGKPQHGILDRIRKSGNMENHEIRMATDDEAADLLSLATMLIKSIYFMP